jgi:hypothetical protein
LYNLLIVYLGGYPLPGTLSYGLSGDWAMGFLIEVAYLLGLLLPILGYYRITRDHKRSAGILLIVAGVLMLLTIIGGPILIAAGALALSSHPEKVVPPHVAESILPVNR